MQPISRKGIKTFCKSCSIRFIETKLFIIIHIPISFIRLFCFCCSSSFGSFFCSFILNRLHARYFCLENTYCSISVSSISIIGTTTNLLSISSFQHKCESSISIADLFVTVYISRIVDYRC